MDLPKILLSILLVSLVCVVLLLLAVLKSHRIRLRKIPISMLVPFLRPQKMTANLFRNLEKVTSHFDGLFAFWIGPEQAVVCDDPVNLRTILMSKDCFNKSFHYRMVPAVGDGILFSDGMCQLQE